MMRAKGPSSRHSPEPPSSESSAEDIAVAVAVAAAARDEVLVASNEAMAIAVVAVAVVAVVAVAAVAGASMPITGSDRMLLAITVGASRSIAIVVGTVVCNRDSDDICCNGRIMLKNKGASFRDAGRKRRQRMGRK